MMDNPCTECPYKLTEQSKKNLCSNDANNLCKHWLKYQGYVIGLEEGKKEEKPYMKIPQYAKISQPGDITNTDGLEFYDINEISVNDWYPLPDAKGEPSQVHLVFSIEGIPHPFILRFKKRRPIDELIVGLMSSADRVFGRGVSE